MFLAPPPPFHHPPKAIHLLCSSSTGISQVFPSSLQLLALEPLCCESRESSCGPSLTPRAVWGGGAIPLCSCKVTHPVPAALFISCGKREEDSQVSISAVKITPLGWLQECGGAQECHRLPGSPTRVKDSLPKIMDSPHAAHCTFVSL